MRVIAALILLAGALAGGVFVGRATAPRPVDRESVPADVGQTGALEARVVHVVERHLPRGNYSGRATFVFRNRADRPLKAKLPVVRRMSVSPTSVQYENGPPPPPDPFAEQRVLDIAPGAEVTLASQFGYSLADDPSLADLVAGRGRPLRYAFVFDVPDGASADEWVSGTVITEPVEWRQAGGGGGGTESPVGR
jgi:hypothetical protein